MSEPQYLTRKQAADFLTRRGCIISSKTLANMAVKKEGPSFFKDVTRAIYTPEDLELWRKRRLRRVEMEPAPRT